MYARFSLKLTVLSIFIIIGIVWSEETCTSNCRLTWTRNVLIANSTGYGCGSPAMNSDPGCTASYYNNQTKAHVEMDKKLCMTFDDIENITYIGSCPYNSLLFLNQQYGNNIVHLPKNVLELNNFVCNISNFTYRANYIRNVCGQQRCQGMLCSKCGEGLGPAVLLYTHPCVECKWYGWLLLDYHPIIRSSYHFVPLCYCFKNQRSFSPT